MNKPIKFRVIRWCQDSKPYLIYPESDYHLDSDGEVLENYGTKEEPMFECVFDDYAIPQQYTGSTDSAQNPIYEGDVVLWHSEDPFDCTYRYKKMIVGWNQRCMQFRLYEFPNDVGSKSGEQFWPEDVRVIGHIFDYENEECRYHLYESVKGLVKQL